MPSIWDYVHIGRNSNNNNNDNNHNDNGAYRNLQEGLMQIASQTCSILVQVNNTNNITLAQNTTNIQYNNYNNKNLNYIDDDDDDNDINNGDNQCSNNNIKKNDHNCKIKTTSFNSILNDASTSTSSRSRITKNEQSVVLIPPTITTTTTTKTTFNRRLSRTESARKLFSNYKHRLSTVLEGNHAPADDDFELWDQSQMWRSKHNKWNHGSWCKPSCIPITVILTLIVLVVLLPLLEHANEKTLHAKHNGSSYVCTDTCSIQLVESIPEGLNYSDDSPKFMSTYDAWTHLLNLANNSIDIGSFYWTLRGSDFYNHSSAWQGEKIFQQLLNNGGSGGINNNKKNRLNIRIAQSAPTKDNPNLDTEFLAKRKAANIRSVNFPRIFGGGVLHTKLWIIDEQHFYLGSANMDWRSLTQVKELGVLVQNCTCLAKDISKIFNAYWYLGRNNSHIPAYWPDEYNTKFNLNTPIRVNFNNQYEFKTFFSSSPPPMSPRGRMQDLDTILDTILHAEKFVHIAVMDYFPLTIYTPTHKYWPYIDDAIRTAAIENKVSIKMLISWWSHSRPEEDNYLRSLKSLSNLNAGIDIQIKRFIIKSTDDQAKIPFGRVNHNKYMVTDNTAYIGTSNWSGDYFTDTAGIGFVLRDVDYDRPSNESTIRTQLASVFERDWNSEYAVDLAKETYIN